MTTATQPAPTTDAAKTKDGKKPAAKKDGKAVVKDALAGLKGGDKKADAKKPASKAAAKAAPETPEEALAVSEELAKRWESWPTEQVPVETIVVKDRYRKDADKDPELPGLARSIATFGLLQPIGVDKESNRLIWGERRLLATKLLKRPTIKAVIVDPATPDGANLAAHMLMMELEENDQRKNPSVRDRVARAEQVKKLLQKGHGKPAGAAKKPQRERVAAAAGMSHETLRQARVVLANADTTDDPELKKLAEQMDTGKVSPQAAYKQVLAKQAATLDGAGVPVAKQLAPAFASRPVLIDFVKDIKALIQGVQTICAGPAGGRLAMAANKPQSPLQVKQSTATNELRYSVPALNDLLHLIAEAVPFAQCPVCAEKAKELGKPHKGCPSCGGTGHVGEDQFKTLEKAADPSVAALRKLGEAAMKDGAK